MSNILKSSIKKSRDKLLAAFVSQLERVDDKISRLASEVDKVHEAQLAINHNQLGLLNEINDRDKNSGVLVLSESEMVAKLFSGIKIYLDPRDIAVAPHIALDSIWEHRITAAWLAVIRPNDVVLDIGSNFGYFGALAAQKTDKKHSKVIHFEANYHLIPYIRKTLSVNWLNEQSVIENVAVADKEGEVTLNLLKDYTGSSSVHTLEHTAAYLQNKMNIEKAEAIKVKAITIDSYCKTNKIAGIDLIKMDIEGFEDKAYAGMRQIVRDSPSVTLFVEFTKDSYEQPEVFYDQLLEDFGHVYIIDNDGYITKPEKDDYATVVGEGDDWVMPIFSKRADLENR